MTTHRTEFYTIPADSGWTPANKTPYVITFTGEIFDAHNLGVQYSTIPGNQPAKNGNTLALWQSQGIPWGQPPLQKKVIAKDDPTGDQVFQVELQRKPYIVGYATSDTGTAWAATLQFNPGDKEGKPFVTSIDLQATGNDSLLAIFQTPKLNVPSANKNWIGLWLGTQPTWDGTNRLKKVDVESSSDTGSQPMSGLKLLMSTTYCLAYAVGPKDSDLAAWVTFVTQPF